MSQELSLGPLAAHQAMPPEPVLPVDRAWLSTAGLHLARALSELRKQLLLPNEAGLTDQLRRDLALPPTRPVSPPIWGGGGFVWHP